MDESPAPPSSARAKIVAIAAVLWAIAFALSFILLVVLAPTGDGFVRGMNKVMAFASLQFTAFVLAAITLFAGLGQFRHHAGWRWLARAPLLAELLVAIGLGALIMSASFRAETNAPPPAPTPTAPVAP